jgi:uncharacterized membrane protein
MRRVTGWLCRFIDPSETNPLLPIVGWIIFLAFLAFIAWALFTGVTSTGCNSEVLGWGGECYDDWLRP